MLRGAKDIQRHPIYAADGDVGDVEAFFFDDESWKVRYLVVRAGGFLVNRQVLLSPDFIAEVDRDAGLLHTALTKAQVENSPGIEADRPVADQQEVAYYGVNPYWGSGWEAAVPPVVPTYPGAYPGGTHDTGTAPVEGGIAREEQDDPHLRSTKEVNGYRISATDGEV